MTIKLCIQCIIATLTGLADPRPVDVGDNVTIVEPSECSLECGR